MWVINHEFDLVYSFWTFSASVISVFIDYCNLQLVNTFLFTQSHVKWLKNGSMARIGSDFDGPQSQYNKNKLIFHLNNKMTARKLNADLDGEEIPFMNTSVLVFPWIVNLHFKQHSQNWAKSFNLSCLNC